MNKPDMPFLKRHWGGWPGIFTSCDAGGERYASETWWIFVAAFAVAASAFLLEVRAGFNLWDEGYLWYGVQRTLSGEVPLRDFMSYDPGRYYWAAALLKPFHAQGIVAVRLATAAFAAIGVAIGAAFISRHSAGSKQAALLPCIAATFLCLLWMVPWWKQYDETVSIVLLVSLAHTLSRPCSRRFFVHGVVVGGAAIFGRNHGLYGAFACFLAVPFLIPVASRATAIRWALMLAAGVLLGFSPILVALCVDHGFAEMFWESIRYVLFEHKGTNIPLPVPWPWSVPTVGGVAVWGRYWVIGCMFVLLPLFCLGGMVVMARGVWRDRKLVSPAFSACVLTAVHYLNVAFSRADIPHLAQAIFPFLFGVLLWPLRGGSRHWVRGAGVGLLVLLSLWMMLPMHPLYARYNQGHWQRVAVGKDKLWMSGDVAASVEDIQHLANQYLPKGGAILSVPAWPGSYALLGMRSPIYEIYPLLPRSSMFQQDEIARLEKAKPALVLFNDVPIDGRSDLRYGATHPLLVDYIDSHYRLLPYAANEPSLKVYVLNPSNLH